MDGITIGLAAGGISASLGLCQHDVMAHHTLSTESADSAVHCQHRGNQHLIFNLHVLLICVLTPMLIRVLDMDVRLVPAQLRVPVYQTICLPIALLSYRPGLWFVRSFDQTERDTRERCITYMSRP